MFYVFFRKMGITAYGNEWSKFLALTRTLKLILEICNASYKYGIKLYRDLGIIGM